MKQLPRNHRPSPAELTRLRVSRKRRVLIPFPPWCAWTGPAGSGLENGLKKLEETRGTARAELAILGEGRRRLEELEQDGEALMEGYAGAVPEALEKTFSLGAHRAYKVLRLRVLAYPNFRLEVNGVLGSAQEVCLFEPLSRPQPSRSWPTPGGSWSL